jgi:hypothetical protein
MVLMLYDILGLQHGISGTLGLEEHNISGVTCAGMRRKE